MFIDSVLRSVGSELKHLTNDVWRAVVPTVRSFKFVDRGWESFYCNMWDDAISGCHGFALKPTLDEYFEELRALSFYLVALYYNTNNLVSKGLHLVREHPFRLRQLRKLEGRLLAGVYAFSGINWVVEPLFFGEAYFKTTHHARRSLYPILSGSVSPRVEADLRSLLTVHDLTWQDFQTVVARMFDDLGYEVFETGLGADDGVDIIAVRRVDKLHPERLLIQCKKLAEGNKVGVEVIRELLGVTAVTPSTGLVCATSTGFTRGAQRLSLASMGRLKLVPGSDINSWLQKKLR
jgi:HJR/Mrr/RecB family endonuclease